MGRKLGLLFALFCVGTVLAQISIFAYMGLNGTLTQERVGKLLAAARGETPQTVTSAVASAAGKPLAELPSLDEIDQARSLKARVTELRELSIASNMNLLNSIHSEIDAKIIQHRESHDKFMQSLKELREGAVTEGREKIRALWEKNPPKDTKDQIMDMAEAGERDDVVAILGQIAVTNQVKIITQFKTPKERKELAEILRDIRKGSPLVPFLDKTIDDLDKVRGN